MHYVIKFVSDLQQVDGFFPDTPVSTTNKTDRHDITEILLKVALNTINQPYLAIQWNMYAKYKTKSFLLQFINGKSMSCYLNNKIC